MRQKEVPGRYCRSNICRGFRHLQSYPCQGAPELSLEAAIPYAGRLKTRDTRFHELLRACDGIKVVCQTYIPSCFMQRNRYMAGQAHRVIAVYDGRERGGTLFTMREAHTLGKEVRLIKI